MAAVAFRSRSHVVGCLVALLLAATIHGSAAATLHPNERDGWVFGLGFGGGGVALSSGGQSSDREYGATGHLRAGYFVTPKVSLGVEGNFWDKTIEGVEWTFDTFTAAATLYPGEGWLLRAGIGGGTAEAAIQSGSTTVTSSESGLGLSTGVGYEVRVARTWAVVPQVDFSYLDVDSFSANYFTFSVAAHWYLLPKK